MMNRKLLKRNILASAIASCTMLGANGLVMAEEELIEEIEVTGIINSLKQSMDRKRDASGVVDSITAEDMGKFPDTNLAESLQRITGVSIDRNNGEGQEITVRGLGPNFNLVTLNGRQMPTSGLEADAVNASRSFDFSNIASESIAGVDVYKTSRADIPTGGVGATVNVRTTRPLDSPGMKFTIGGKAVYDESQLDPEVTPEISGLFSNTYADDTIGVALSLSKQERKGGYRQVSVPNGWHTQSTQQVDGWFAGVNMTSGELTGDDHIIRPQNIEYNFTEFERDRTNGQLTLQWAPSDAITATLDYTFSEQEIASTNNTLNIWFWEGEGLDEVNSEWAQGGTNNAGGNVFFPVVFNHFGGDDLVFGVGDFAQVNENNSVGLNVQWDVTDRLTLEFDYHDSKAESKADSPFGNSSVIQTSAFVRAGAVVDFSEDFAVLGVRSPNGGFLSAGDVSASDLQPTGSSLRNSVFTNDIEQMQIKGTFDVDQAGITSIDFGLARTENSIHRGLMVAQRDNWSSADGDPSELRDEVFEALNLQSDFDEANGSGQLANDAGSFDQFNLYYGFSFIDNATDVVASQAPANSANEVNPSVWPCADRFCVNNNWTTDQRTEEISTSAYFQVNFEHELDIGILRTAVGLRYEETDVESSAVVPAYSGIDWVADNEFSLVDTGASSATAFDAEYDYFLPSIDVSLELENNVVLRASASKTISRPNYNDISGGVAIGTLRNIEGDAQRGDPTLLPHESKNYDLSAEWYYGDSSYVAVGFFRKDVTNFAGITTSTENLFGLRNPSQGPRFQAAVAALGSGATTSEIRDYIKVNFPDTVTGNRIHSTDDDPLYDFNVTIPFNESEAEIKGIEFAIQHTFDNGFGAQFNYTWVDSDAEYDDTEFEDQFALVGLSDTMNVVAFYENDSFAVRLAYNWRDEFLTNIDRNHGNPEFVEEYSQWDLNMSYQINDELNVFMEGLNITDESTRSFSRYSGALQSATEQGPRYNLGIRYTF
ncbi:TonB-dependent receptor [Pseudomaricurvus alkylphenolicus]|uniref:TonB-dependent receptor n=1 Tax=Pseudomaricurvus alkylphenolicus TaxID=1306991 RepID=UPI001F0F8E3F|nr:TonB-dependent receptor [Pseudomaricurvus alkylphenolicus]